MTSTSTVGSTRITLQFDLDRNIDGAARDVEAAINAARADLPTSLRQNPTYRKVNPADAPIAILAMTSDTLTRGQIYDAASTVMQQALSQIERHRPGSDQRQLAAGGAGRAQPAGACSNTGSASKTCARRWPRPTPTAPRARSRDGDRRYQIYTNDQASHAADYRPLVVAYRNGAAVHLTDVAEVDDSVENLRNQGLANGKPAVLVILYRQPGANIIDTVDRVKAILPQLQASIPSAINVELTMDRTTTIRTSLHDVERALLIAVGLVILVVFLFLRNRRATLIPSVAVPVSLIGTFGAMYLLGYSLDNLSLMALTVSTGFVVDDAIVVLENITRHIEAGMTRMEAALLGAREVGFTVLSMSLSLIAVFVPILLMGGIVGRLFREFAMTLSVAILISLAVSLTTTPMMCAYLLATPAAAKRTVALYRAGERAFEAMLGVYDRSLRRALRWPALVMLSLAADDRLNVYLFMIIPKGFFPQQDTGRMIGGIQADQSISFQPMEKKLTQFVDIIRKDPAVENVVGFTGGGQTNSGFVFVVLKPLSVRKVSVDAGDRPAAPQAQPGRRARGCFCRRCRTSASAGGRATPSTSTLCRATTPRTSTPGRPKVEAALQKLPQLTEVNLDQQQKGLETDLVIDRATAARLGLTSAEIDNTLYDAFGQRQVSVIYAAQNQYHVVMEVAPQFWQNPETLKDIYVSTSGGTVSGTQSTNALAGTIAANAPPANGTTDGNDRGARSPATPRATRRTTRSPIPATAPPRPARRSAPRPKPWCRCRRSLISSRATRRSRSTTRACSSPRRSRSTWRRACRSARRSRRSTRRSAGSACRRRSMAASRARPRSSSNPWPTSRS